TALAAIVSTVVSASIGVSSLALGGLMSWADAPRVWLTWWLGDAVGDIVIAPALILWIGVKPAPRWNRAQSLEALALAAVTALVLLDLDGLKQINDRHGHLAGSLAIRRMAEALLGSCRGTDTAARYGGDEFALVLPETGEAAAWHVARGVADRLATDAEKPNLSISVGVAVYPGHGETVEALLNAADIALYETKERRKTRAVGLAP